MQNQTKANKSFNLRRSPVSRASVAAAMMIAAPGVFAAAGFGDSNGPDGGPIRVQTYYANSPTGQRAYVPPEGVNLIPGYTGNTGKALRKFVDPLPMVGASLTTLSDGVTSKYIPLAVATKWVSPQGQLTSDDYYEVAVVEYTEKLHSDLKSPTRLRGYVQIDVQASNGGVTSAGSKAVPLFYPDGITPIMIAATDANGKLTGGAKVQAKAYDNPHYLGPAIVANRGTPTRVKFINLLPVGRYDATLGRRGDIFVPADETIAGAGVGPDGVTRYTQNRALIHLHGGDNPWISDGTPHQWITPAGERAILGAEMAAAGSTLPVDTFLRGAGAVNVPDMNDPGDGAMTYYFPNRQSARLEWYHDHSYGLTRLNVYTGMAAPYVLAEPAQDAALQTVVGFPKDVIRLVIQDKTFVPEDIKLQDGRWNAKVDATGNHPLAGKPLWGENSGDLWYPHVYEVNQDPSNGLDGTNPVGRWDWGPYFWPVFPALYNLPTGGVDDVTLTPESWMDTPVLNGVAYPTTTLEARAQRFQILNGANDRFWNLSFFVADSAVSTVNVTNGGTGYNPATTTVTIKSTVGTGATATPVIDATGKITAIQVTNAGTGYSSVPGSSPTVVITGAGSGALADVVVSDSTEVKMVPAAPIASSGIPACAVDANGVDIAPPYAAANCWPSTWPTDGREGGVPDPATAGPKIYQIGNEGGLLPKVAEIAAAPMQYEYNRRSITVLNTFTHGLFMGNAERADFVVDLKGYEGKTLILYSDSPAPVPAFDPRNDHWTGKPDESAVGSVETPKAGFGPNTRTLMQIRVGDTAAAAAARLQAAQAQLANAQTALTNAQAALAADQAAAAAAAATLATSITNLATAQTAFDAALATYLVVAAVQVPGVPTTAYTLALLALTSRSLELGIADTAHTNAVAANTAAQTKLAASIAAVTSAQTAVTLATSVVTAAQAAVTAAGATGATFTKLDVDGPAGLKATLPQVYGNPVYGQESPVVAQSVYNAAFGKNWSDAPQADGTKAFATIFTGTLQEPTFRFTPGTPNGGFDKIVLAKDAAGNVLRGSGYITPPVPVIAAPAAPGVPATAVTTLRVDHVNVVSAGSGYKFVPTVTFGNTGTGTGAAAVARMQVSKVTVGAGGSGYDPLNPPAVSFSMPEARIPGAVQATGTAIVNAAGIVTGMAIVNAGFGYTTAPLASIAAPAAGTRATVASTELNIARIDLVSNDPNHPEFAGGAGYNNMNLVTVTMTAPTAPGGVPAVATVAGSVFDITLVNTGSGYLSQPIVAIPGPVDAANKPILTGVAAQAVAASGGGSILVKNKAIQELFDPTYGRMNATLGIEVPFTSALTQTTIPLGYVDPTTEEFADGETQIWKITHNGVDSHPVHFHLLNVQVVNRIGWDGTIKPPMDNEYGWKETVRMNPLEDIVVAVRAKKPVLGGFGLPLSQRLRDPSQPADVPMGFTQVDVLTGAPAVVTNKIDNFGWEYVWHCHILGHEENDFMRPVKFNANEAVPAAPTNLALTAAGGLTWTDNASTEYKYQVYTVTGNSNATTLVATELANANSTAAVPAGAKAYGVVAVGANGVGVGVIAAPVAAPTALTTSIANATTATIRWTDSSTNEANFVVEKSMDLGVTWSPVTTINRNAANSTATGGVLSTNATGLVAGTTYVFRVTANGAPVTFQGQTSQVSSVPVTSTLVFAAPDAPTLGAMTWGTLAGANAPLTVNFAAPATGAPVTTYSLQYFRADTLALQSAAPTAGWTTRTNIPAASTLTTFNLNHGTAGTTMYWVRMFGVNPVSGAPGGAASPWVLSSVTP